MDGAGIALVITACGGLMIAFSTAFVTIRSSLRSEKATVRVETKLDEVHAVTKEVAREVHTINHLTLGEKSDADESRRIDEIPEADRTKKEQVHVDIVGTPEEVGSSE